MTTPSTCTRIMFHWLQLWKMEVISSLCLICMIFVKNQLFFILKENVTVYKNTAWVASLTWICLYCLHEWNMFYMYERLLLDLTECARDNISTVTTFLSHDLCFLIEWYDLSCRVEQLMNSYKLKLISQTLSIQKTLIGIRGCRKILLEDCNLATNTGGFV